MKILQKVLATHDESLNLNESHKNYCIKYDFHIKKKFYRIIKLRLFLQFNVLFLAREFFS